jgi:hypothetical protein|tara:strand:+ start:710 stop:1303 length:594 start_codon:yes stop_codon:yes gene_type:complete
MPSEIKFKDFPEFTPNLTPKEIFMLGSFHDQGGYWRDIKSTFYKNILKDTWKKYIIKGKCLEGVDIDLLVTPESIKTKKDKIKLNKYNKKAGTSLDYWHQQNWMRKQDPYGWVQWYCEFYDGRRSPDDKRQIMRWVNFTGINSNGNIGRWKINLMNKIKNSNTTYDDEKISPTIRQSLQHWAYQLTEKDYNMYKNTT